MDLNHIIVAMQGDRIVKVQCRTCNKEHTYRAAKGIADPVEGAKKVKTRKPKASAEDRAADGVTSIEAEWNKLMTVHKDAPFKGYSVKAQFGLGDKLKHASFGEGIVNRLIYPNKVEVVFKTDIKVLIHGGAASILS
jgi:hypothetical protein